MATAKAVAAGNSCRQEDIIAAANMGRKAIADLLRVCKVRRLFIYFLCDIVSYLFIFYVISSVIYLFRIFAIYTGLQAYDAILTHIYDFCRFKLTIIPRFIFELLSVCSDTSYVS